MALNNQDLMFSLEILKLKSNHQVSSYRYLTHTTDKGNDGTKDKV